MHLIEVIAKQCELVSLSDLRPTQLWKEGVRWMILNENIEMFSLNEWNEFFSYVRIKSEKIYLNSYEEVMQFYSEYTRKIDS